MYPTEKMCHFFTFLRLIEPNSNNFGCSIGVYYVRNFHLVIKTAQEILDQIFCISTIHDEKLESGLGVPLDDEERPLHALVAPSDRVLVEAVGGDAGGGDEDVGDGGVEAPQNGEVEQPRALPVRPQVRHHLAPPPAAAAPRHEGNPSRRPERLSVWGFGRPGRVIADEGAFAAHAVAPPPCA